MDPKKFRKKQGPEAKIQREFIAYLQARGWRVERMIGNALQMGIPDIYVMHSKYGTRWIDLKNPIDYEFTKAQRRKWPRWEEHGVGIWIITGWADEDYAKLFESPNWRDYWKDKYDEEEDVNELLQELYDEFDSEHSK